MEFKEVVEQIEQSEKNVDKVLKAARLKRHEKGSIPADKLGMIFGFIAGMVSIVLVFAFLIILLCLMKH